MISYACTLTGGIFLRFCGCSSVVDNTVKVSMAWTSGCLGCSSTLGAGSMGGQQAVYSRKVLCRRWERRPGPLESSLLRYVAPLATNCKARSRNRSGQKFSHGNGKTYRRICKGAWAEGAGQFIVAHSQTQNHTCMAKKNGWLPWTDGLNTCARGDEFICAYMILRG